MGKAISVHSSRGGTGKSIIAVNLAMALLKKRFGVSLLDLDFRAPALNNVFREEIRKPVEFWLNDYFNGRCNIDQTLLDLSENCNAHTRFLVGLANPSVYAVCDMIGKSQRWEASALRKLHAAKSHLFRNRGIDYIIYDTSPGIQYSSINAVISSELPIIVTTSDSLDIEGVNEMISEFYDAFEKNILILVNKAFPEMDSLDQKDEEELVGGFRRKIGHPVIGVIPCYCQVLRAKRDFLLGLRNPDHPFVKKLEEIAEELVRH